MASEVHLNDIGTVFELTIKDGTVVVDVSGQTTMEVIFLSPGGTRTAKGASFKTNGTDGVIQYTTVADDLNEEGRWQIQGHVVLAAGDWKTDLDEFVVHRNL